MIQHEIQSRGSDGAHITFETYPDRDGVEIPYLSLWEAKTSRWTVATTVLPCYTGDMERRMEIRRNDHRFALQKTWPAIVGASAIVLALDHGMYGAATLVGIYLLGWWVTR